MRPSFGPPAPDPVVTQCRDTMHDAHDPVDVVEAVLTLIDRNRAIAPVGGGMAIPGRARPYARALVAVLDERGLLVRQGRML